MRGVGPRAMASADSDKPTSMSGSLPSCTSRPHPHKKKAVPKCLACASTTIRMFSFLLDIDLQTDYAAPYEENRAAYLADAEALKKATGPYKAARDAYVAATATFTKSLYE